MIIIMMSTLSHFFSFLACVDEAFEKAVDIAFLIDSSERATDYFERELNLVKAIVKAFKIKLDGNRAGLISYGSAVVETIELGTENTVEKFNQAVSNLKKEGKTFAFPMTP